MRTAKQELATFKVAISQAQFCRAQAKSLEERLESGELAFTDATMNNLQYYIDTADAHQARADAAHTAFYNLSMDLLAKMRG